MRPRIALALLTLGLFSLLAGCSADHATRPGFGSVKVLLTDAPGDFDQVNIVVREVHIHRVGASESEWITVRPDSETTYNLLELQNGVFATLGFADGIPSGTYDQLRLVLGEGSHVVQGGATHPLTVPSGQQSGLKAFGSFDVPSGGQVEVVLDFDAARSIHVTGNGKHMLKPVLRLEQVTLTGAISGQLAPATEAQVHAIMGPDSVTAVPGTDGVFTLAALPEGTYDVSIDVASGFRDTTITGVQVVRQQTTQLGTITLSPITP